MYNVVGGFCFLYAELLKVGQWCVLAQENRAHAENLLSIAICSRAESTGNKYQAAFIRWRNFASSKLSSSYLNPGQFITYLEEVMKSSKHSVEEACNAATWIHGIAGLQSPVEDGTVRAVMEGARRLLAKRVVKKEPVSVEHLQQIVANTDMSNLGDVRTATLCLLCFSAFLRLASTPGSLGGGKREPGTHCLRMRQNLRKDLRKTTRLLLTSTWFIYVYVVYQVQIRRLNKISASSSSLWLSKDYKASKRIEAPENNRSIPRKGYVTQVNLPDHRYLVIVRFPPKFRLPIGSGGRSRHKYWTRVVSTKADIGKRSKRW